MPYLVIRKDYFTNGYPATLDLSQFEYRYDRATSYAYFDKTEHAYVSDSKYPSEANPRVWPVLSGDFSNYADATAKMEAGPEGYPADRYKVDYIATEYDRQCWRDREMRRLRDEKYAPIPWESLYIERLITNKRISEIADADKESKRFAHLSVKTEGKIAYTEDDRKGYDDRQTAITPGRYLQRFHPGIHQQCIDRFVSAIELQSKMPDLQITTDPDEIVRIYRNGPVSCMGPGYTWEYGHPCQVYGSVGDWQSDLAVAYLGTLDDAKARAVVWPERKRYTRIYGNTSKLEMILTANGYTQHASLTGAKIRIIPAGHRSGIYLIPYIDGSDYVGVDDRRRYGYLDKSVGSDNEQLPASEQQGYARLSGMSATCDRCGEHYNSDDDDCGNDWCPSCYENVRWCDECGTVMHIYDDDCTGTPNGYLCENCYSQTCNDCAFCKATFSQATMERSDIRHRENNGTTELCEQCADRADRGFLCRCEDCDTWQDNGTHCADCEPGEDPDTDDDSESDDTPDPTVEPIKLFTWDPGTPIQQGEHLSLVVHYNGPNNSRREPGTIARVYFDGFGAPPATTDDEVEISAIIARHGDMVGLYPDLDYRIVRHSQDLPLVMEPGTAVIL